LRLGGIQRAKGFSQNGEGVEKVLRVRGKPEIHLLREKAQKKKTQEVGGKEKIKKAKKVASSTQASFIPHL